MGNGFKEAKLMGNHFPQEPIFQF